MSHPIYSISHRRLPPFPGNTSDIRRHSANPPKGRENIEVHSDQLMKSYLSSHPKSLDEFVDEFVTLEKVEHWLKIKQEKQMQKEPCTDDILRPRILRRFLSSHIVEAQQGLLDEILEKKDLTSMLYDMTNVLCKSICAQNFAMFIPRPDKEDMCVVIPPEKGSREFVLKSFCALKEGSTIAGYVAKTSEVVLVQDTITDERFPEGTGVEGTLNCSVIAAPVITPSNDVLCIMQFTRHVTHPFSNTELQAANAFIIWIGIGIYQSQVNRTLSTQAELNNFLLQLTKIIFDDVIKMDRLIEKIMMFTKDLVNADRCSLFLVDTKKRELYANLFDEGVYINNQPQFVKKDEIRFPMDKGIAGAVATTGEIINISDAYADPRFNKDVDLATGYTTRCILSIPIVSNTAVIGVVQMLNKKTEGAFTNADVTSFQTFMVYSALALHYSKMYHDLVVLKAQFHIATEQLNYHSVCEERAVFEQMKRPLDESLVPEDLEKVNFYAEPHQETILTKCMVRILLKIGSGGLGLDTRKLFHFVLTVKKSYRPMPYHNWQHGWHVAHSLYTMFSLLQQGDYADFLQPLMILAHVVAGLCHDVDHRGYNNQFMVMSNDPLAVLYESSTMEQHHFNTTLKILQHDQHNIFSHLSPENYKTTLHYIETAIMATDLATYLKNINPFSKLVMQKGFDLQNKFHREDLMAIIMTAADLCIMFKPWAMHKEVTLCLYEEFWCQGDFEKLLGKPPISMMDRDKGEDLAKNQVGFMVFVCMPCYSSLAIVFPELRVLVDLLSDNLHQWEANLGRSTSVWEPCKSRPEELNG